MELVFEIITRNNKVLSYHKTAGERISIGRSYDNDVVIQEPHVCPRHAELTVEEGRIMLTDLNSINGIKSKHNKSLGPQIEVKLGDVVMLGKVLIRIVSQQQTIAQTKRINLLEDISRACNHWYWALLAIGLYYFILLADGYDTTYQEIIWSKLIVAAFVSSLVTLLIPLFIALMSRMFKKEVRFFTIVTFCFSIAITWLLLTDFGQLLSFNWGDSAVIAMGAKIIDYLLLILFVAGSFYLASQMSVKRILTVSCVLVAGIASLVYINKIGDDSVKLSPNLHGTVLNSKWLFAKPVSAELVKQRANSLFSKATEEAQRRNLEAEQN